VSLYRMSITFYRMFRNEVLVDEWRGKGKGVSLEVG